MVNNFSQKSCHLWDNVEKILYSGTVHRWQYGARALHAGYLRLKHTHRICNSYCFSTATMVAWMRLIVTLYVHCPSYSPYIPHGLLWDRTQNTDNYSNQRPSYGRVCVVSWTTMSKFEKTTRYLRIFALLGCNAAQIDSYLWTFRYNLSVPTSSWSLKMRPIRGDNQNISDWCRHLYSCGSAKHR
jgi:hypothetical protein